ncbi:MAG: bifunctional 3-demethylubiquinol 3-O-methyltransferase/2-polyprenyl-6-hydroxyphenol methylase [Desulfobacterales bacterium]|nr:MAG: bifunctional 3-demethylubiquinol 3-O-methyltransferase/2-polyprenyl-6-hydroxyphenol methylase [Desulfobacterales bacterium]
MKPESDDKASRMNPGNLDAVELARFEALQDRWWEPDGAMKSLHDINPYRMDYIRSRVGSLSGLRVLDMGCGGGILSEALARDGAHVTGLDMGAESLAVARHHAKIRNLSIQYRLCSAEDAPSRFSKPFDIVVCMELLEHVPSPADLVSACAAMVKPGGDLIFATLNRTIESYLFAIIAAEYILRMLPVGTHRHDRFIRPSELIKWGRPRSLVHLDTTGLRYAPFSGRFFLSDNSRVNYFLHFQRSPAS